jgi:hypothetical protein
LALLVPTGALAQRDPTSDQIGCPDNLLKNPGFEAGFEGRRPAEIVGRDWQPWYETLPGVDGLNYVPDYRPRWRWRDGAATVHSGLWSQELATHDATHTAGLWQRVDVPPDSLIDASVWAHAWATRGEDTGRSEPPGTYVLTMGLDPLGGEDPHAARITWTPPITVTDAWVPLHLALPVEGSTATLFLRGQPLQILRHNASRWDSACLRAVGPAGEPTLSPTPRPPATRTPRPGDPTWTPSVPTLAAIATEVAFSLEATALSAQATATAGSAVGSEATMAVLAAQLAARTPTAAAPAEDEPAIPLGARLADQMGLLLLVLAVFLVGLLVGLGRGRR